MIPKKKQLSQEAINWKNRLLSEIKTIEEKEGQPVLYWGSTTDGEFVDIIISTILGENWYCVDSVSHEQTNTTALIEILKKLGYKI